MKPFFSCSLSAVNFNELWFKPLVKIQSPLCLSFFLVNPTSPLGFHRNYEENSDDQIQSKTLKWLNRWISMQTEELNHVKLIQKMYSDDSEDGAHISGITKWVWLYCSSSTWPHCWFISRGCSLCIQSWALDYSYELCCRSASVMYCITVCLFLCSYDNHEIDNDNVLW